MSMLSQIRNWRAGPMDGSTIVYSVKNHLVQLCTDTGTRLANNCACRCSIKAMDRHSVDHEKVSTAGYTAIDEFEDNFDYQAITQNNRQSISVQSQHSGVICATHPVQMLEYVTKSWPVKQ